MIDPETIPDSALQRLGGRLADLLDEDQWNNTEKNYLLPALGEFENLLAQVSRANACVVDLYDRYKELREDRDKWKAKAEKLLSIASHN